MPIPCPCCKAANDAGPNCRRCKADLSLLFQLEFDRAALVVHARELVAESRFSESLAALDRAAQLRRGDDVQRLRVVALLLSRDYAGALAAYHDCDKASGRA
jgi:hypothetical protein